MLVRPEPDLVRGKHMEKLNIICPCCEATLTVDSATGAILAHEEKKKITGSFEDLKGELSKQKDRREQLFAQEMSSMKDRERLLEEKFQEALKRADKSDTPFRNPLDMD
jgi:cell division protein FtsB